MKKAKILVLILAVLFLFAGCKKGAEEAPSVPTGSLGDSGSLQPEEKPQPKLYMDPLTGEMIEDEEVLTRRPIVVSINNIKQSLPQEGIGSASIIYELEAEGGITRLLAVFNDYTVKKIGSVRSARHYFLDYALGHDALFVHFGGSPQAYSAIKKTKIDHLDGINLEGTTFYRDKERRKNGYVLEHTAFTDMERILEGAKKAKYEMTVEEQKGYFNFSETNVLPENKDGAYEVTVKYPNLTAKFSYDEHQKTYLRTQYGKKHIDGATEKQLAFENLFVVYTSVKGISGDDAGRLDVTTSGSGKALYITDGGYTDVTWEKKDKDSKLRFLDANGEEIKVNTGKTMIEICTAGKNAELTPKEVETQPATPSN